MRTAQSTASTALANSINAPSPMSLTIRPRYSVMRGSIKVARSSLSAAQRSCLVRTHETAVANHVGRHKAASRRWTRVSGISAAFPAYSLHKLYGHEHRSVQMR